MLVTILQELQAFLVFAFVLALIGSVMGPAVEPWTWRWRLARLGVSYWILATLLRLGKF